MSVILEAKTLKEQKAKEMAARVAGLSSVPTLAILQIGDREDSTTYIAHKERFAEKIGAKTILKKFPTDVTQKQIVSEIGFLNNDKSVHGIIVQLPIPLALDKDTVLNAVTPEKDVDGLGAVNTRKFLEGRVDAVVPATTRGILALLGHYDISLEGKKVTIVGRSTLVGKPAAIACINEGATVTVCHSKTNHLKKETASADILIVAIGKPRFITADFVKKGQVVIDVGINSPMLGKLDDEPERLPKVVGDVDYNKVHTIVDAITPVPGGVGQMTVVSLFENLLDAFGRQR
jgi:methylenetetrahydrofolate dehydrogenase (NADP+) / methenyltetrahydrofolate cyclohydrolase